MHNAPTLPEMSFLEAHLKYLMEDARRTPKLQLERAIGPLLTHFIARAMSGLTLNPKNADLAGQYRLICPEFPLKKGNAQSINIDFLLVNETTRCLTFLELKTDRNSIDPDQIDRYQLYISGALKSRDDIATISKASRYKDKYKHQGKKLEHLWMIQNELDSCRLVFLAPSSALKEEPTAQPSQFHKISFSDLPENIKGDYAEEWSIIRRYLLDLDKPPRRKEENNVDNASCDKDDLTIRSVVGL